jgi:NitT/TauT family transport system ATP-binding protein
MTQLNVSNEDSYLIKAEQVTKVFQDRRSGNGNAGFITALDGVNLGVKKEEIVTIVGPSGCGKTTLLNIIAGFESLTSGELLLRGKPISGIGPDRSLVFQSPALFPWLTVLGNVVFGAKHTGRKKREYLPKALAFIESVGLTDFQNHYPYQLSGGMKQRVQLARSLLNNPEVLLMDEPFGPLDWQTRSEMQELLLKVWQEYHPTILMVTHDVEEAIFISDRVYVLTRRPGRIKMEIAVTFPKPRKTELVTRAKFVEIKSEILQAISEEGLEEVK